MIKPKKSLGQNFLKNEEVLERIALSIEPNINDIIIEIGPGLGALTKYLLNSGAEIYAVEIDIRAIDVLKKKFPEEKYQNFHLIHADFTDFDLLHFTKEVVNSSKIKVIGNIPYYLSSVIVIKLCEHSELISICSITTQKEVAERLVAKHNSKQYGTLSVATQLSAKAKILFDIAAEDFYPIPKVVSSTIQLDFTNPKVDSEKLKSIMKVVRNVFQQRRKKLHNSFKGKYDLENHNRELMEKLGPEILNRRPDAISPEEYSILYEVLFQ